MDSFGLHHNHGGEDKEGRIFCERVKTFEEKMSIVSGTLWRFQSHQWNTAFRLHQLLVGGTLLEDVHIKLGVGEGKTVMLVFMIFLERELGRSGRSLILCEPIRTVEITQLLLAFGLVAVAVDVRPTNGGVKYAPAEGVGENLSLVGGDCEKIDVLLVAVTTLLKLGVKSCEPNDQTKLAIAETEAAVESSKNPNAMKYMTTLSSELCKHDGATAGPLDPPRASLLLNALVMGEVDRTTHWQLYTKLVTVIKSEVPEKSGRMLLPAVMKFCAVSETRGPVFAVMSDEAPTCMVVKRLRNLLAGCNHRIPFVVASATATNNSKSMQVLTGNDQGLSRRAPMIPPVSPPTQPLNASKTLQHTQIKMTDTDTTSLYEQLMPTLGTFIRLISNQTRSAYYEGDVALQTLADSIQVKLSEREGPRPTMTAMTVIDLIIVETFRQGLCRTWTDFGTSRHGTWDTNAVVHLLQSKLAVSFFLGVMKSGAPLLAKYSWSRDAQESVFDKCKQALSKAPEKLQSLIERVDIVNAKQFLWIAVVVVVRNAFSRAYNVAVSNVDACHEVLAIFSQLSREHTNLKGREIVVALEEAHEYLALVESEDLGLDRTAVFALQRILLALQQTHCKTVIGRTRCDEVRASDVYQTLRGLFSKQCEKLARVTWGHHHLSATARLHCLATPSLVRQLGSASDSLRGEYTGGIHLERRPTTEAVIYVFPPPKNAIVWGLPGTLHYARSLSQGLIQNGQHVFDEVQGGSTVTLTGLHAAGYFAANYGRMSSARQSTIDSLCAMRPVMHMILDFATKAWSHGPDPSKLSATQCTLKQEGRRIEKAQSVERDNPRILPFAVGGRQGTNAFAGHSHTIVVPCANHDPDSSSIEQLAGRLIRTTPAAATPLKPSVIVFHTPTPLGLFDVGGIAEGLGDVIGGTSWVPTFCHEIRLFYMAHEMIRGKPQPTTLQQNLAVGATHAVISGELLTTPPPVASLLTHARACLWSGVNADLKMTHLRYGTISTPGKAQTFYANLHLYRRDQRLSEDSVRIKMAHLKTTASALAPVQVPQKQLDAIATASVVAGDIWDTCQLRKRKCPTARESDHAQILGQMPWSGVINQAERECELQSQQIEKCKLVIRGDEAYRPFKTKRRRVTEDNILTDDLWRDIIAATFPQTLNSTKQI